ncbi:beta-ketoacyl synthase N-terminal-like domain-containing protein [Actinokineospora sp.]|uniref:beta-ketoacyl synthase N-terminal-like domain-containing protein n=1 Tax=Actinokineospora sp. TaxID=1872133 RepID=UPI0040382B74
MRREIAVAGLGLVTGFGVGVRPFWDGLLAGRVALRTGGEFDTSDYLGEPVGEVPGFAVPAGSTRKQALLDVALAEALHDAGYPAVPAGAVVIVVGQTPVMAGDCPRAAAEMAGPARVCPGVELFGGGPLYLSHACASAAFGAALAREIIEAGAAEVAVVVGASALNPVEYASMHAVRAVGATPARPFDRARAGITVGEGAGALVLVAGGPAEVVLSGAACRVGGAKAAASDEDVVLDCLRRACGGDPVDYVHAHATGTKQGDSAELGALRTLAGELGVDALPASSHKGAIGHLLHASCFPSVVAATLALRHQVVPPTAGLLDPEPTDRVVLPRHALTGPVLRSALVNSFGFGGNNAALTLRGR